METEPPEIIKTMLAVPGRYMVFSASMRGYTYVEVEADGTCHQLTSDYVRDGVLSPDGWGQVGGVHSVRT